MNAGYLRAATERNEWQDRAEKAEAEIERLRAALQPFANYAECFNRDFEDNDPAYGRITVGDFRRARKLLTAE
jgi:hypothetical protein